MNDLQNALREKKILIIEDDTFIAKMYAKWFSLAGAQTFSVPNGAFALETLGRERIDLILLDLGMPGMGGEDTLAQIRAEEATRMTPVLVVTNTAREENPKAFARMRDLGVSAILQKYETSLNELLRSAVTALGEVREESRV
jgi:CheY-like chemotaxis protein